MIVRIVAVITARKGSKGLPGKNIRNLCGKPLIAWTIEQACHARLVDKVVVSTDGEDIAQISREFGAEVPFLRPDHLASDTATSADVLLHALDFLEAGGEHYDLVLLLEPTSPLRVAGDIDALLENAIKGFGVFRAVVSITKTHVHPSHIKKIEGDLLLPFIPDAPENTSGRRQDYVPAYFPFGGMYAVDTRAFRELRNFYASPLGYHEIADWQAYEIDALHDFLAVEAIMKHRLDQGERFDGR